MFDQPARVWRVNGPYGQPAFGGEKDTRRDVQETEYIRADLVAAEIDQMKMENAKAFSAGWDAALSQMEPKE